MAATPSFAATLAVGSAVTTGTADTSLTAPTNVSTVLSGGASGTVIHELVFQGCGTTTASFVQVFLYDGSNYRLVDQVPITAATPSSSVAAFRTRRQYENLFVKSGSSLRITTYSGNLGTVCVTAFGGDI